MIETNVLVIGGSAGGILTATTARKAYGDIDITLIRDTEKVMVPCGIPYIFGTLHDTQKNVIPDKSLQDAKINLILDRVTEINREKKIVITNSHEEISYHKLVIATGSLPIIPTFIPGYDLENVFTVLKDQNYLNEMLMKVKEINNVVVIGGGFIGVEFAEQLNKAGKKVTLVEMADEILWQAFDVEYSKVVEASLIENGVSVLTSTKVKEIKGNKQVEEVLLANGESIAADMVVLGLGVKPNNALAKECGLLINNQGAVVVDQYMRTSDPDVFAVGDCAEKHCFFTGKEVPVLLASTAAMEAKVAGCNLFQLRLVRANKGTISAFSTQVYGKTFAAAGMTEARARQEKFSIMVGEFTTMDRHPGSLPGTNEVRIKLIFSKCSGVILGGQISGGEAIAEMINILSLAIQKSVTASELNTFQVATHPLVSASPIAYPINAAAMNAIATNCRHLNEDLQGQF